jgi:hypothetical protein
MAGMGAAQIGGMTADAMAGFGKDQMAALDPLAMAGMGAAQIGGMTADAMAGFGKDQMAALDPLAMAGMGAAQIGGMTADAMAGFGKDQMAALDPNAMTGFDAAQMAALAPTAMGGFSADQVSSLDPTAMSGFGKDQVSALGATAMGGFGKDQMSNLDPTAMGGFVASQTAALDPTAVAGLGKDQMAGLTKDAMGGFDADKAAALTIDAMSGLGADQMSGMSKDAMGGLTTDQFKELSADALGGLGAENIGGLGTDVIANMSLDNINSLNVEEVKTMSGKDSANLLTNVNPFSVDIDTMKTLVKPGWDMDDTGKITAPPGAELSFKGLPVKGKEIGKPTVVALPDLSTTLAVGGGTGGPSVLDGMTDALTSAGVDGLNFTQSDSGVLKIGDGTGGPATAAFIPDAANMTQAPEDSTPGVDVDPKTGGYIMITAEGYQIPLKGGISDPDQLASLVDGEVEIGAGGQTSIETKNEDGTVSAVAGIPNPILTTDSRPPGTYTDGDVVKIVYADGSAQELLPAIKDQDALKLAAAAIPGVDNVNFRVDGLITLTVDGAEVKLKPSLKVEKGVPGATVEPGFSVVDGKTYFTSKNGDKQEFAAVPVAAGD